MDWKVPLADVQLGAEEETAVLDVLRSGWLTMGAVTQAFEEEICAFTGTKHAFAVNNATAALHLACMALGLGPGDEVIAPSLTFVATANAIKYTGAKVVFADIESEDWLCICPEAIKAAINEKTKAIMVMHYAGYACDMPEILRIAKEHNLYVIEDAAHAIGASLEGKALGAWGDIGCYSFFGNKNMTTAEGGMLVTDNDDLAAKVKILRSHGMTSLTWDRHQGHASNYDVIALGYNYRIDEIRSAIGRQQLKKLSAANARRKEIVQRYRTILSSQAPELSLPFGANRGESSYHLFPVLLPKMINRANFREILKQEGVQTSFHYPPVHHFEIYRDSIINSNQILWMTEHVASRQVTLPLFPQMSENQLDLVIASVVKALEETGS